MVRLGIDKDKPVVVLQWDSLIAVNYPARTFGISRMDKLKDAKKRCPELIVVHVATYKEGEKEPGYWDDIDTKTHKVRPNLCGLIYVLYDCMGLEIQHRVFQGFAGLLSARKRENIQHVQEWSTWGRDR